MQLSETLCFQAGVRVPKYWDTELWTGARLVFTNYRVHRLWLTTFEHDSFEQNDAYQDAAVAGIGPAFGGPWDKYHGAPIVVMRTLTVLSIGKIPKVSRLSGQ